MEIVLLVLGGIVAAIIFGSGIRASFYRWEITYYIQIDPRYQNDPNWRRAADRALFDFKEAKFALQYGLISSIPRWTKVWRYLVFGGILMEFVIVFSLARLKGK